MFELGKREDLSGMDALRDLGPVQQLHSFDGFDRSAAPIAFPELISDDDVLICGYNQGRGERMIVCDNFEDMKQLYAGCEMGSALNISWYVGSRAELMPVTNEDYNLTTPDGVAAFMSQARSEADWDARLEEVCRANDKDYPEFWFDEIIDSGLAAKIKRSWAPNLESLSCD